MKTGRERSPFMPYGFARAAEEVLGVPVTFCDPLSLSVACHIGPGALAIACSRKLDGACL